ncbi:MAG: hypothetical protein M1838_005403 [Thelocarpon superellum]|nr:MAG: hypothetical protein M1838_005403 [Thelocarpon superellum]
MSTTVHVTNISSQTSEKEVRDFFSFCGKITSLSITPSSAEAGSALSATVTFEKETAAKTALLLDNTQLGPSHVQVTGSKSIDQISATAGQSEESRDEHEIQQEDKPRSRIVAEYLAHGYVLGDQALQHAIELDNKHGISQRFTSALTNFDSKYHATDKARSVDASYGVTEKGTAAWRGLNSYFETALGTQTGQKVVDFYSQSEKQVRDIHAEARRLADLRKAEQGGATGPMGIHSVPGTNKTACNCGGNDGTCPCAAGKCSCSGCSKAEQTFASDHTATGAAPEVAAASHVAPLGSNLPGEAVGGSAELAATSNTAPLGSTLGGQPEKTG